MRIAGDRDGVRALNDLAAVALLAAFVAALPHGASAQSAATTRSAGPAGEDGPPAGYASPSAIPEPPTDERFGIPRQGRITIDPIALPDGVGRLLEPDAVLPSIPAFAPQMLPNPTVVRPEHALVLTAQLEDGTKIPDGLVWRLFDPTLNREGQMQLIGVVRGGEATFDVPAGSYLLHVGYGRAGIAKRIEFSGLRTTETVTLEAGGLRLSASAANGEGPIRSDRLTFDVYSQETPESERRLVASKVPSDVVLRLNAGTYHVVSSYGSANKVAADVRVEAGRITGASFQHHAAELTMKLVREAGGEAIADTAWSIASSQGDIIPASTGPYSTIVLPEGDYVVIARNRDRTYQRELTVRAGQNAEIELEVSEAVVPDGPMPDGAILGSGD